MSKQNEDESALAVAPGSAKLTSAQKALLETMTHEWARVPPHTRAATLLSLRDKGLIKGRGHPSYGMACFEMPYNSNAWQWCLWPNT